MPRCQRCRPVGTHRSMHPPPASQGSPEPVFGHRVLRHCERSEAISVPLRTAVSAKPGRPELFRHSSERWNPVLAMWTSSTPLPHEDQTGFSCRRNDEQVHLRVGNASTQHGAPHCTAPPLVQFLESEFNAAKTLFAAERPGTTPRRTNSSRRRRGAVSGDAPLFASPRAA